MHVAVYVIAFCKHIRKAGFFSRFNEEANAAHKNIIT